MITEMVFLGHDNENEFLVEQDGQPVDFTGVTRMRLSFDGSEVTADSLTFAGVSWTNNGRVQLRLGSLAIAPSRYMGTLVAYDPVHDDGQVIFHAAQGRVQFWFVPP
jgi:hypothetical protein